MIIEDKAIIDNAVLHVIISTLYSFLFNEKQKLMKQNKTILQDYVSINSIHMTIRLACIKLLFRQALWLKRLSLVLSNRAVKEVPFCL